MDKKILIVAPFKSIHIDRWFSYFNKNNENIEVKLIYSRRKKYHNILLKYLDFLLSYFRVRKIIRQYQPDVINYHTVFYPHYLLTNSQSKLMFTPWNGDIVWVDLGYEFYLIKKMKKVNEKIRELFIKKALLKADLITYNSSIMKIRIEQITKNKITIKKLHIPGVDTTTWDITDMSMKKRLRNIFHFPEDAFIVLSMRSFGRIYNIDIILEAAKQIIMKHPEMVFIFIGHSSNNKEKMLKSIRDENIKKNIKIIGKVEYKKVRSYYQCSDIGISISSKDSSPQSVIEGLSIKLPMIVGDIDVIHELVENGKNGIIVPCRDVDKLVEAIMFLRNNMEKRNILAENARNIMVENFDYKNNMAKVEKIYKEL